MTHYMTPMTTRTSILHELKIKNKMFVYHLNTDTSPFTYLLILVELDNYQTFITSGAGTAYPSGAPEFKLRFLVWFV